MIVWLLACNSGFEADMRLMCEAPNRPEIQAAPLAERPGLIAQFLHENLTNDEVVQLFRTAAGMNPEIRKTVFLEALERAHIQNCPIMLE